MELGNADPLRAGRRRRVLITGAGGQLGHALQQVFAGDDVLALSTRRLGRHPAGQVTLVSRGEFDLVLHTAAWTDVDGAEADPQGAAAVNIAGTAHAAALKAPLVTYSTDYVFDGRKRSPYVESDGPNPRPPTAGRSSTARRRQAAGVGRPHVVALRVDGHNFLRTMLRLGAEREEVAVVDDQRGCPTYVGHLAEATRELVDDDLPRGPLASRGGRRLHVGRLRGGDLRGGRLLHAGSADLDRGARAAGRRRPAYSVLRSGRANAPRSRTGGRASRLPRRDGRLAFPRDAPPRHRRSRASSARTSSTTGSTGTPTTTSSSTTC